MPDARCPSELQASDEASELQFRLQQRFEEDVASDVYTECNIRNQEKEILSYLRTGDLGNIDNPKNCDKDTTKKRFPPKTIDSLDVTEIFFTPKSTTPYTDKKNTKSISSSPSIEFTKEYYALVPVEKHILDKELKEQDVLSTAFKTIRRNQVNPPSPPFCAKPTSLPIKSSHLQDLEPHTRDSEILNKNKENCNNTNKEKNDFIDITYSPDSLITEEHSSSSDYLSAANYSPPGVNSQLSSDLFSKIDCVFTSSDSGVEYTAMESVNGQNDITLNDVSLTESTLLEIITEEESRAIVPGEKQNLPNKKPEQLSFSHQTSTSEPEYRENTFDQLVLTGLNTKDPTTHKSSKEEKQRLNEEIVILESSSLSSETGSWESVFPPKTKEKDICISFLNSERQNGITNNMNKPNSTDESCSNVVQKSNLSTTSCFIDASSLLDDEDNNVTIEPKINAKLPLKSLPIPSQPMPCSASKGDISPNDWSECQENDDSLNQKDSDSLQKDLSPSIFEMTPLTEDSLCGNFVPTSEEQVVKENENIAQPVPPDNTAIPEETIRHPIPTKLVRLSSTPNNSMLSLQTQKEFRFEEYIPIVSGGASVEDHLPQPKSVSNSPLVRRKIECMPIISGAYVPDEVKEESKTSQPKPSSAVAAWVVDMSSPKPSPKFASLENKRPSDRTCDNLRNESKCSSNSDLGSKSRSSIDSDSSEKSSHKFYIDLSNLPDASPQNKETESQINEKKNIFSMYFDFGDKILKETRPVLSSSLTNKKSNSSLDQNKTPASKSTSIIQETTSKKKGPAIMQDSVTHFEEYEKLCSDPKLSLNEIIESAKHSISESIAEETERDDAPKDHNTTYVRLTDLDKPKCTIELNDTIYEHKVTDVRMTRSIPENKWLDDGNCQRSIDTIHSFHSENALSLNRLFPHLKTEFSRSMPGLLTCRTKSPFVVAPMSADRDHVASSEVSEVSSVQSSYCRSTIETSTTEESQTLNLINSCHSKLGQDLLRMFLEEIAPDVVVEAGGRRFKAHKCILASRCQYFAAMLSGGRVESAGNVIVLPPFSYNVLHFILCHIYSGVSKIPESINTVELTSVADILGLEGLKEAITFNLKAKYCHNFHKPCNICIAGVMQCFPLSSVSCLDDLYLKCLKWITKYFYKVWPTKAFASLPNDLMEKCYQHHIVNMHTDNILDTVCGCGIMMATLHNSRWAESVARYCRRLMNAAAHFIASRLYAVLSMVLSMPEDLAEPALEALVDCITAAIEWAPADEACRSYEFLTTENKNQSRKTDKKCTKYSPFWGQFIRIWKSHCERAIVLAAPRAVNTQAFKDLSAESRKRLRELGCITYVDRKSNAPPPNSTRPLDLDHVRNSFVPYAAKPSLPSTACKPYPPAIRSTVAQEKRAKYNFALRNSQDRSVKKNSRPNRFENTKPRYLEPRPKSGEKMRDSSLTDKMASSSESSVNSKSPVQPRHARVSRIGNHQANGDLLNMAVSQDSLATSSRPRTAEPSTDSLSESQLSNKYATYTKPRNKTLPPPVQSSGHSAPMKTKIPVRSQTRPSRQTAEVSRPVTQQIVTTNKPTERQPSLMMATKSSSAKVVPKMRRDMNKTSNKKTSQKKNEKIVKEKCGASTSRQPPPLPVMERSGTFVKDESTFGIDAP